MKMSGRRQMVPFLLGALSMIISYTVYHNIIIPQQKYAIQDDGSPIPTQGGRENFDEVYSTTSHSLIKFEVSESNIQNALKERLNDVGSRIKDVDKLLEERKREIGIDEEMVNLALKHKTSVKRLIQKFKEVLLMNRTFALSVVGGSISVGAGVDGTPGIYATTLGHYLTKMLGSEVTVENGAVGATNSYYYGYCFETHCNVRKMDLLLWEFAHNDFGYPDGIYGQERLTRMILADLPNEPQLIYTNFLHGKQIDKESCENSEKNGSVPLSKHYDVPSISMPDAVCKQVKEHRADYLLGSKDESHPGPNAHDMVGVFLAEFLKEVLIETIEILEEQLSKGPTTSRGSIKEYILEDVKPDFKTWNDEELHQKLLPPVLFNTTAITHPQCWSLLGSEYRPSEMAFMPQEKLGWTKFNIKKRDDRTDLKAVWRTLQPDAVLEFAFSIPKYRDLNCTIAITTITSENNECGRAKVFLDDEYITLIDCMHRYLITLVHEVALNVPPGRHTLKITSVDKEGFNVAAVSAAFEIPDDELEKM
ncbi:uncharacterized protein [Ptychodera flava]|uniref:uncharacterized protein n=1 Tax=Ptychodera flava TaxID=63121 RepID=UPI003969DE0E